MNIFDKKLHEPLIDHLHEKKRLTISSSGNVSSKAFFIADILQKSKFQNIIWVVEDADIAEKAARNMQFWLDDKSNEAVSLYTEKEEGLQDKECSRRICELIDANKKVMVMDVPAYFENLPSKEDFNNRKLILKKGEKTSVMDLINELLDRGYDFTEDSHLEVGQYFKQGGIINIFSPSYSSPLKIEVDGDKIVEMYLYDQHEKSILCGIEEVSIVAESFYSRDSSLTSYCDENCLIIRDELDLSEEYVAQHKEHEKINGFGIIDFTAFPEDDDGNHFSLFYLSMLKYRDIFDFVNDLREKKRRG